MKRLFVIFCFILQFFAGNLSSMQKLNFYKENTKNKDKQYIEIICLWLPQRDIEMDASDGDINSQLDLANDYFEKKDIKKAKEWLDGPLSNNHPQAWFLLGRIYQKVEDFEKALKAYELAAAFGEIMAENYLGIIWNRFDDKEKALNYFKLAAGKGCIKAQWNAGYLYENYKGNLIEAKKYYTLAAIKGHIDAAYNLAMIFYKESKQKNKEAEDLKDKQLKIECKNLLKQAKRFFKMAAKSESESNDKFDIISDSNYNLGVLYEEEENNRQAMKYYWRAQRFGCDDAKKPLDELESKAKTQNNC